MKTSEGEARWAFRTRIVAMATALTAACGGGDESVPPSSTGGAAGTAMGTGGVGNGGQTSTGGNGGAEPDASMGPSDLGKACPMAGAPAGCSAALTCMQADSVGGYVCTKSCSTSADCPSNGLCYTAGQSSGGVCARVCTHQVVCVALGTSTSCAAHSTTSSTTICAQ